MRSQVDTGEGDPLWPLAMDCRWRERGRESLRGVGTLATHWPLPRGPRISTSRKRSADAVIEKTGCLMESRIDEGALEGINSVNSVESGRVVSLPGMNHYLSQFKRPTEDGYRGRAAADMPPW